MRRHGWQPEPDQIIFRANIILAETDEAAQAASGRLIRRGRRFRLAPASPMRCWSWTPGTSPGEARPASVNRALPINFVGGPDTIVAQIQECRERTGAGVIDLGFQTPGSSDPGTHLVVLEMFGKRVLPLIRDM